MSFLTRIAARAAMHLAVGAQEGASGRPVAGFSDVFFDEWYEQRPSISKAA